MYLTHGKRLSLLSAAVGCAAVLAAGLVVSGPADAAGPAHRPPAHPLIGGQGTPTVINQFAAPLVRGYGADPTMVYDGQSKNYYLTYNRGSTNEMVMRRSPSLAGLATAPDIVIYSANSSFGYTGMGAGGYLKHYGTHWYIYNGTKEKGISVLESAGDDALGPYHIKAFVAGGPGPHDSGYAFQAVDIGGQYYGFETSNGEGTDTNNIYITTMSNPWTVTGTWNKIVSPAAAPGGSAWDCADHRCIDEGTSIAVHDGRVYDLFSAGGYESPDYCVGMTSASLSANLLDAASWTKVDHCVFQRNDAAQVYGPGSMTFFNAPDGSLWVIYHVKTSTELDSLGADRRLEAQKVEWNSDGTPNLGQPYALGTYHTLPGGDPGISTWKASQGVLRQVQVRSSSTAADGQYVTGMNKPASSMGFKITEASAGTYRFRVRYASNASGPVTQDIYVNGTLQTSVAYQPAGSASGFYADNDVTVDLKLAAGVNTVDFRPDGSGGVEAGQLSLDQLIPVTYDGSEEAIDGKIQAGRPITAATATGFVRLGGYGVEQPFYVGSLNDPDSSVTFTVIVPTAGTYGVQVYYDNGGANTSTMQVSVNGAAPTTPSFPATGAWGVFGPDQYVTVPVSLRAGENTIRFGKGTNFVELDRIYVPQA